jgi:hypothetical protein
MYVLLFHNSRLTDGDGSRQCFFMQMWKAAPALRLSSGPAIPSAGEWNG